MLFNKFFMITIIFLLANPFAHSANTESVVKDARDGVIDAHFEFVNTIVLFRQGEKILCAICGSSCSKCRNNKKGKIKSAEAALEAAEVAAATAGFGAESPSLDFDLDDLSPEAREAALEVCGDTNLNDCIRDQFLQDGVELQQARRQVAERLEEDPENEEFIAAIADFDDLIERNDRINDSLAGSPSTSLAADNLENPESETEDQDVEGTSNATQKQLSASTPEAVKEKKTASSKKKSTKSKLFSGFFNKATQGRFQHNRNPSGLDTSLVNFRAQSIFERATRRYRGLIDTRDLERDLEMAHSEANKRRTRQPAKH